MASDERIFDLLEGIADRMDYYGYDSVPLRVSFARGTEGVDIDFAIAFIVGPLCAGNRLPRKWEPLGVAPAK